MNKTWNEKTNQIINIYLHVSITRSIFHWHGQLDNDVRIPFKIMDIINLRVLHKVLCHYDVINH